MAQAGRLAQLGLPALLFMLLRLPTSRLFPYTTLFRSIIDERPGAIERGRAEVVGIPAHRIAGGITDCAIEIGRAHVSSHPSISYAVFCLKKKNAHLSNIKMNWQTKRTQP